LVPKYDEAGKMNILYDKLRQFKGKNLYALLLSNKLRIIREWYCLRRYDDLAYIKMLYKERIGVEINLINPTRWTEKLQWLKLFYRNADMPVCADKYRVREFIQSKGYGSILNELIGVYGRADEIDINSLPQRFALKANHGSGWNYICKDKHHAKWWIWKQIADSWLDMNCYVFGREWNYQDIEPRLIVEKYIDDSPLVDYKILCFNGMPKYLQINQDIDGRHYVDHYDLEWKHLDFTYDTFCQLNIRPPLPAAYTKMLAIAKELSTGFPFVRIDLYDCAGRITFGEMTFFPSSGFWALIPPENNYDEILGQQLILPAPNHNLELYQRLMRGKA